MQLCRYVSEWKVIPPKLATGEGGSCSISVCLKPATLVEWGFVYLALLTKENAPAGFLTGCGSNGMKNS